MIRSRFFMACILIAHLLTHIHRKSNYINRVSRLKGSTVGGSAIRLQGDFEAKSSNSEFRMKFRRFGTLK